MIIYLQEITTDSHHYDRDSEEDHTMKRYTIKSEFLSSWGDYCDEDTIIDTAEVERLAEEWETPVEELLEQLIEIETIDN